MKKRKMFIRFARKEIRTIRDADPKIVGKKLAKLVIEKWNKLHPDLKGNKRWVYELYADGTLTPINPD